MYESLALSVLSALSSFLFNNSFTSSEIIEVEGAPHWYGKNENSSFIESYGYNKGDIEYINFAKKSCEKNISLTLTNLIDQATIKELNNSKEPYYNDFIETYKNKQELEQFLTKTIQYDRVYYKEKTQETFSKCSIPKVAFLEFEKELLKNTQKSYSNFKLNKNIDELDKEIDKL